MAWCWDEYHHITTRCVGWKAKDFVSHMGPFFVLVCICTLLLENKGKMANTEKNYNNSNNKVLANQVLILRINSFLNVQNQTLKAEFSATFWTFQGQSSHGWVWGESSRGRGSDLCGRNGGYGCAWGRSARKEGAKGSLNSICCRRQGASGGIFRRESYSQVCVSEWGNRRQRSECTGVY